MKNTRELYNEFGKRYHEKRNRESDSLYNRYLDQPMIDELIGEHISRRSILDLGCGSGMLSKILVEKGAKVHGIDISETLIELARKECPTATFHTGDMNSLPFKKETFDWVVSALVVHYEQNLVPVFKEVKRMLRPKGKFVFTIHHPVMEVLDKTANKEHDRPRLNPYFHQEGYEWEMFPGMKLVSYHHTFEEIAESLYASGFVIERILEARATESIKERFPDFYAETRDYPSFCGFRASHACIS